MINVRCGKVRAYKLINDYYDVSTPSIIKYLNEFESTMEIKKSLSGRWQKLRDGLNTNELILKFIKHIDDKIKSKKHFDIQALCDYANADSLRDRVEIRNKKYCKETVRLWMKQHGYKYGKYSKGIYIDGHEREDVMHDRENFVHKIYLLRKDAYFENGEEITSKHEWIQNRIDNEKITYIMFYHDESIFYKWD